MESKRLNWIKWMQTDCACDVFQVLLFVMKTQENTCRGVFLHQQWVEMFWVVFRPFNASASPKFQLTLLSVWRVFDSCKIAQSCWTTGLKEPFFKAWGLVSIHEWLSKYEGWICHRHDVEAALEPQNKWPTVGRNQGFCHFCPDLPSYWHINIFKGASNTIWLFFPASLCSQPPVCAAALQSCKASLKL